MYNIELMLSDEARESYLGSGGLDAGLAERQPANFSVVLHGGTTNQLENQLLERLTQVWSDQGIAIGETRDVTANTNLILFFGGFQDFQEPILKRNEIFPVKRLEPTKFIGITSSQACQEYVQMRMEEALNDTSYGPDVQEEVRRLHPEVLKARILMGAFGTVNVIEMQDMDGQLEGARVHGLNGCEEFSGEQWEKKMARYLEEITTCTYVRDYKKSDERILVPSLVKVQENICATCHGLADEGLLAKFIPFAVYLSPEKQKNGQIYEGMIGMLTDGMVSQYLGEGVFAVTGTKTMKDKLREEDIVFLKDGQIIWGNRSPSVETYLVRGIFQTSAPDGRVPARGAIHVHADLTGELPEDVKVISAGDRSQPCGSVQLADKVVAAYQQALNEIYNNGENSEQIIIVEPGHGVTVVPLDISGKTEKNFLPDTLERLQRIEYAGQKIEPGRIGLVSRIYRLEKPVELIGPNQAQSSQIIFQA